MASYATQSLGGWRNEACLIPITVPGLDLAGIAVRAQIRQQADNPVLTLDLPTTVDPAATGIRVLPTTHDAAGIPTSHLTLQITKAAMQALPYAGELGDAWVGEYALQIAGVTRLIGPFAALASPIDSDAAPANRPVGWGGAAGGTLLSGVVLTIGDGGVTVSVTDADLLAPLVAAAQAAEQMAVDAASDAGRARDQTQAAAITTGYHPTLAAGVAATSIDQVFTTDQLGALGYYRHTAAPPYYLFVATVPAASELTLARTGSTARASGILFDSTVSAFTGLGYAADSTLAVTAGQVAFNSDAVVAKDVIVLDPTGAPLKLAFSELTVEATFTINSLARSDLGAVAGFISEVSGSYGVRMFGHGGVTDAALVEVEFTGANLGQYLNGTVAAPATVTVRTIKSATGVRGQLVTAGATSDVYHDYDDTTSFASPSQFNTVGCAVPAGALYADRTQGHCALCKRAVLRVRR